MKYRKLLLIPAAAVFFMLCGCKAEKDPQSFVSLGMEAIENHDYQGALEKFETSIAADKSMSMAYRGEGIAYMGLGDYDKAILCFQTALDHTKESWTKTTDDIRLYLALAQYRKGDYGNAVQNATQVLGNGESADAYYLRGASYLQKGDEEKAKGDYDKAAALSPGDYNLFFNIYESYSQKNLSAKGDEYLQKALSINGEETNDYYQRGRIYYYLENYEKAKEQLVKPAEAKDKNSLLLLGRVYLALEDPDHARNLYQQYMEAYGESCEAYNGLALCSLAQDSPDEALAFIQKGLALGQEEGSQDLYYNEIVAYERKLDFAAASQKAEAYILKYPDDKAGKKEADFLSTR